MMIHDCNALFLDKMRRSHSAHLFPVLIDYLKAVEDSRVELNDRPVFPQTCMRPRVETHLFGNHLVQHGKLEANGTH